MRFCALLMQSAPLQPCCRAQTEPLAPRPGRRLPATQRPTAAAEHAMVTALQHTAPRAASAVAAAAAAPGPLAPPLSRVQLQQRHFAPVQQQQQQQCRQLKQRAAVVASAAAAPAKAAGSEGHTALLHGLGEVGEVAPVHMPWLLRLAHIKSKITGGDSNAALQESARGLLMWKVRAAGCLGGCGACGEVRRIRLPIHPSHPPLLNCHRPVGLQAALERGLVLDDFTIQQLIDEKDSFVAGQSGEAHTVGLLCSRSRMGTLCHGKMVMMEEGCLAMQAARPADAPRPRSALLSCSLSPSLAARPPALPQWKRCGGRRSRCASSWSAASPRWVRDSGSLGGVAAAGDTSS